MKMRAIILAAGRGSRMGDMTETQPKCRTVFQGKELIEWQLEALQQAGICEIAIVRGYLKDSFDFDVTYFDNDRWQKTNMVESLVAASQWLKEVPCIVSYSDIVYSNDVVRRLMNASGDISITYDPEWKQLWETRFEKALDDAETFKLDHYSRVIEIGNKAESITEIEGQYMGLLRFCPSGWEKVLSFLTKKSKSARDALDMTGLLQRLIAANVEIIATPIADHWYEVDTVEDLEVYKKMVKQANGKIW